MTLHQRQRRLALRQAGLLHRQPLIDTRDDERGTAAIRLVPAIIGGSNVNDRATTATASRAARMCSGQ
jgi:hypothetical protein